MFAALALVCGVFVYTRTHRPMPAGPGGAAKGASVIDPLLGAAWDSTAGAAKVGASVPEELAGIRLGAAVQEDRMRTEIRLFGLQGMLITWARDGRVNGVEFRYSCSEEEDPEKLVEELWRKISQLCGTRPEKEHGLSVWRGRRGVFFLSSGRVISVVLRSADPGEPGNQEDGFESYLKNFKKALLSGNPESVADFLKFPFKDRFGEAYPSNGSISCKDREEFIDKYPFILNENRKGELLKNEPVFDPSAQVYSVRSEPSEFIFIRDGGAWRMAEFAYRE